MCSRINSTITIQKKKKCPIISQGDIYVKLMNVVSCFDFHLVDTSENSDHVHQLVLTPAPQ